MSSKLNRPPGGWRSPSRGTALAWLGWAMLFVPAACWPTDAMAARFGHGDLGSFGIAEVWNHNGANAAFDDDTDEYSARFTVVDNVTVDRAWQRFISATDATVFVGIMADDGAGNPTGSYLSSTTVVNPGAGVVNTIFPSVALTPGTYHLVTQVDTLGSTFSIHGSSGSNTIRPYDRAEDLALASMFRDDGGSWNTVAGRDPYFGLGDETGPLPQVMQQVYNTALSTSIATQGGTGSGRGQRFMITEGEVPADAVIRLDTLKMSFSATSSGDPVTDPLLVRLRDGAGNILATMVVQPEQADGSTLTLAFDPVFIYPNQEYLLTTEFGGSGGASNQFYRLPSILTSIPGGAAAGWGGTTFATIIQSGASNNWTTWSDTVLNQDLRFNLLGTVYLPEPTAAAMLLATAGAVLAGRRRTEARL